jgi:hypothetical protein
LPLQDILDLLKTSAKTSLKTTSKNENNPLTGADAPGGSVVVDGSLIQDETGKDQEIETMAESEQEDLDVVDDFEHDSEIGFRSMDGDYRPAPDSHPASTLTPNVELGDIREWNTPAFGFSAERLRNCLIYVLDHRKDDYYRENPPTLASMCREKFVRKLDADTQLGWTPELVKQKEQKKYEDLLDPEVYKADELELD